ncbi:hypothetical protein CCR75_007553 [Bremia lactucae]|uniref:MI domain-containing protein n=1 Tax=Bremia lactucae TaxID=4779 RepID=A0A976ILD2_BRELC|nr:hypothetical protein CCR75_007553 [Bremia lactucae]
MITTKADQYDVKTKRSGSPIPSNLRPTAAAFIFNTAAPVFTPSKHTVVAPIGQKSQLKRSAKPFVPSLSPPVVPTKNVPPPTTTDPKTKPLLPTPVLPIAPSNSLNSITSPASIAAPTSHFEPPTSRLLYTIEQLVHLQPAKEHCRIPESIANTIVAAENATKTLFNRTTSSSRPQEDRTPKTRSKRSFPLDTAPALEDCVPLSINDATRWKPSCRLATPIDSSSVESSLKQIKAILNKLSIEKFEILSNQLIHVAVRNIDVLKGVIPLVIAKAQMEWHFATMYAELCAKLAHTAMPAMETTDHVRDTHQLFRKLLLQHCQEEFEHKRPGGHEFLSLTNADQEKERLFKRASLGHIRFVGELFKQRMLSSRIMHQCIGTLLGGNTTTETRDEDALECLCNLLRTIGAVLELQAHDHAEKVCIQGYYTRLKQYSRETETLSTRVRFLLQEVLELRKNRWIPRRKEIKAMTLAQVHAEIAREERVKERASRGGHTTRYQRSHSMQETQDKRKVRGMASCDVVVKSCDADGWETVTSGARSKGWKPRSVVDRMPTVLKVSRPLVHSLTTLSSREEATELKRNERGRSKSASIFGQEAIRHEELLPLRVGEEMKTLTREMFVWKFQTLVDEFINVRDCPEMCTSLKELNATMWYDVIPSELIRIGLERGEKERAGMAELVMGLIEYEIITRETLKRAWKEVLESVEEMEIDVPKSIEYLSVMVAPLIVAKYFQVSELMAMTPHLRENGKAARLIGLTLAWIGAMEDENKVVQVLAEDSIDWSAVLVDTSRKEEALQAFYHEFALDFLAGVSS